MSVKNKKSAISGIMITAGCAIGAGMFSLPVVSSGMWFILSIICMVAIWYFHYLSSIYILEVNFQFERGASFDTLVKKILGQKWNFITGLSIGFLFYILLYAYFSAFGNMASHSLGLEVFKENQWYQGLASLFFGGLLAIIVWYSTSAVGRFSTILVIGMIISFILSMGGLTAHVEMAKLFDLGSESGNYSLYLWAALPYFMTSFGFSSVVPSLYKHYGKEPNTIKNSLFYGSLIALLVYILFIFISFGNISRTSFIEINAAGGNMGHLINALEIDEGSSLINFSLNLFSNFAIITSFLGVGLGLFDYIADKFSFPDNSKGRMYASLITFLPPGIASFFFPNGFIAAIGFAGLVVIFGFFVVPYFMVKKSRSEGNPSIFQVWGGKSLLVIFFIVSLLFSVCYFLSLFDILPKW